ncbi:MAG: hypothetical protein ACFFC7_32800 [Candidatus Hermodarchaeota archaeon]
MTEFERFTVAFQLLGRFEQYKIKKAWGLMVLIFGLLFTSSLILFRLIGLALLPNPTYIPDSSFLSILAQIFYLIY